MKHTIDSRKLGKEVTFFTGNGTDYIFVDLNGKPGTMGPQICHYGMLSGSTMTFVGAEKERFAIICRRWWNEYLKRQRNI